MKRRAFVVMEGFVLSRDKTHMDIYDPCGSLADIVPLATSMCATRIRLRGLQ